MNINFCGYSACVYLVNNTHFEELISLPKKYKKKSSKTQYRANEFVRAKEVRLIGDDGEHVGVLSREDALAKAKECGKDLVEVSPDADPPVCKLLDFDKYRYNQQKKKQKQQKKSKTEVKEIRIGLFTEEHDLGFKAKRVREFIEDHNKVLLSLHLSGREKAYGDKAKEQLQNFSEKFTDIAKVERPVKRESSARISMVISPRST